MNIYTASSWRNEELVKVVAKMLRTWGHEVYCFAEDKENQVIFNWNDVTNSVDDGITCLNLDISKRAFANDMWGILNANCCVLLLPSGRDSHLEAGYIKGKGGKLYILGDFPKGEFSNMYHLADALIKFNSQGLSYLQRLLMKGGAS